MANRICIALIIALTLSLCVVSLAIKSDMPEYLGESVISQTECQIIDEYCLEYDGFICFLRRVDDYTVDVYIRPNEYCALQAFDIYIDAENCSYSVISHTGYDITQFKTHIMSIANLLEMEMLKNNNYKIATLCFESGQNCRVKVVRADLAISHQVLPPAMDELYLQFEPINIGDYE